MGKLLLGWVVQTLKSQDPAWRVVRGSRMEDGCFSWVGVMNSILLLRKLRLSGGEKWMEVIELVGSGDFTPSISKPEVYCGYSSQFFNIAWIHPNVAWGLACVLTLVCACVSTRHTLISHLLYSPMLVFLSYMSHALFTFSPSVNPEKVVFTILYLSVKCGGAHT